MMHVPNTDVRLRFRPFKVRLLEPADPIVMVPMTRAMATEETPGRPEAEYYRRHATGGVALFRLRAGGSIVVPRETTSASRSCTATKRISSEACREPDGRTRPKLVEFHYD